MTRILVNHLTRMKPPRICVAGLDVESSRHVRPVTPASEPITRSLLPEAGGPLEFGALIDLEDAEPCPIRPEVEDVRVGLRGFALAGRASEEEFLEAIDRVSEDCLEDAFGPDLQRRAWRCAVDRGEGECSLACVCPSRPPRLEIDTKYEEKLQLRLRDPLGTVYVPVNDLRFYEEDQRTLRHGTIEGVQDRIARGIDLWVMFGLARPFAAKRDDAERHWLQVNGLCLGDSSFELDAE